MWKPSRINVFFFIGCLVVLLVYTLHSQTSKYMALNGFSNHSDISKQSVYNHCKSFSQKSRLLGPLQRNESNGQLFFPRASDALQDVYLLFRYSPRKATEGGSHLQLATSYLLSKNLQRLSPEQQLRTRALVFLSEKYDNGMYERLEKWFRSIYAPYTKATDVIRARAGNQASWEYMLAYVKTNQTIHPEAILFLIEDDYIYEAEMLADTIEFFASHDPCFVHPTDYPDRYRLNRNDDDGRITIVAGKTRLWRSITSATVSYACRFKTLLAFEDIIMQPNNDWKASHAVRHRGGNAVLFSAIPSHGTHTETLLWPKETDTRSKTAYSAYYKDWWLLGRQAIFEAQEKKEYPVEKLTDKNLFSG